MGTSQDNVVPFPHRSSRPRIQAVLRQADSGSRPFLARADNGELYWCKYPTSDHGLEAVVNEVVASVVGERIGAPVRPWTILDVSTELVGTTQGEGERIFRLRGDPLFGSLDLHRAETAYHIDSVSKDGNYDHFPMLIALWTLCDAGDIQMLYALEDMSVCSIDHGFWFGSFMGMPWDLGMPNDESFPALRAKIPDVHWQRAIETVEEVDAGDVPLSEAFRSAVPVEWGIDDVRLDDLADFVCQNKSLAVDRLVDYRQRYGMR
ncbi:HipA family kinase [Corynebacterium nuruki]|uniref:HipA family kinase n=1 Tax=Corynebacterium nuruki TaxID=1032851 RepID=UPI0039BF7270